MSFQAVRMLILNPYIKNANIPLKRLRIGEQLQRLKELTV